MHLLAPGQVVVFTDTTGGTFYPYGKSRISTYVAVPGCPYIEIEDQRGYLWDSDRKYGEDNDCVHSKLAESSPTHPFLQAGSDLLYPSFRYYSGPPERGGYPTRADTSYNKKFSASCGWSRPDRNQLRMRWRLTAYVCTGYASTAKTTARLKTGYVELNVTIYADGRSPSVSRYSGLSPNFLELMIASVRDAASSEHWDYWATRRWGEGICDVLVDGFGRQLADWVDSNVTSTNIWSVRQTYDPFPSGLNPPEFLLNEDSLIRDRYPAGLFNANNFKGYWRSYLIQHAYYDCLQSVPRANENNISNIVDCVSFLKNLIVNKRIEFPESLAEGWLAYRYSYSTTKSDIDAAISYAERHLRVASKPFSCFGISSTTYEGIDITCRCRVDVRNKELSYLDQIWKNLDLWGLSPRFYVFWDMLPYSFIVDWFLPIGDVLSVVDARSIYSEERYEFSRIVYSLSYHRLVDGVLWKTYSRWRAGSPPQLDGFYWFETDPVSSKTVGYRTADATSLILGRRR